VPSSPHDIVEAITETRRAVQELGFLGVFLHPSLSMAGTGTNAISTLWYDSRIECPRVLP